MNAARRQWPIVLVLGSLLAVGAVAQGAPASAPEATELTAQSTAAEPIAVRPIGATGGGTHVVAVGDIARKGGVDDQVAAVTRALAPSRLLLAGDVAYEKGTTKEFAEYFDPDWKSFRSIWLPVPGNHEYKTKKAAGYRAYFGETGALYWSRRVGGWRVIGVDSEKPKSSKQRAWLKRTLRKHNGTPTLVMWHSARYSRGHHADTKAVKGLYDIVRKDSDVKLLVWGHDHDYERMTIPVKGRATSLPAFVVGTGGAELRCDATNPGRTWSKYFNCTRNGVLDLRLRSNGFSWAFVTTRGETLDAGRTSW